MLDNGDVIVDVTLYNYETQEYRLWVNFLGIAKDTGNSYFGVEGRNQANEDAKLVFAVLNDLSGYFEDGN